MKQDAHLRIVYVSLKTRLVEVLMGSICCKSNDVAHEERQHVVSDEERERQRKQRAEAAEQRSKNFQQVIVFLISSVNHRNAVRVEAGNPRRKLL